ncbi:MAG: family 20 glycosylhydrolase, partial [Actinobacteria bacterium]|nr:family 20 glycosylhydrolase [Actinomycetota bacterium]
MDAPSLLPRPRIFEAGHGHAPLMEPEVRVDESLPPEGYELRVTPRHIDVRAADAAGVFYAHHTLEQLARTEGPSLPACRIRDWPDLPVRGVMLDVSRDKVPTMETLRDLVDRLSSWKVNQLQLYMEHTYAYPGHEDVWKDATPFTASEIRELDRFCRDRHVELVPNQNTLGHMQRWLTHDRYRPLALAPDGWTDWKGRVRSPTTLDPSKHESLRFVRELLDTLLPRFDSRRVHVGLDEPWELPHERIPDY